ncbi:hypothetical protein KUTeg_014275 [Tegillarca granosa]|uniref:Uncharacterized protein n=1 Tax=Tegillarca granosa TaxID=220873 RepID=A0ABQ9EZN3_TEGGR|nr:hypothetical protein KUTeg_014275 [Tegillarca granosa]
MKVEGGSNMSGMGFNTSTRKEDLSTRLKTHNIKRAKDETKKLETESRKMEEKLRELRLAMSKEKEDRERRGGGFWSRGQTGNLNNYATDVLNKPVRSSKMYQSDQVNQEQWLSLLNKAIGPRQCMSPQPSNRDIDDSQILSVGDSSVHSSIASVQKSRNGPEGASVSYDGGPSLLDGTYDERENAAAFQEALMAWRSGGQSQQQSPQKAPTPRKSYTPVKTPTVHMDMGTGTMDDKPDVEIKFNTSNLSYAERLMLKKHRRTELDQVNTPRIELTQRERVDFHALYEAITQAKPPEMGHFDACDMIITEMDHSPDYPDNEIANAVKSIKSRPPSAPKSKQESFVNSRPPSSAKSRPKSSARPGSRAWEDARPSSRFSRASSRMQGEGLLTKSPSEELQKVAMMSHSIMDGVYTSALSNFLMLGVDPSEELQEERTLTPTKHKKQKDDKYKVSNKFVDGEDLTRYDEVGKSDLQNQDDTETLDKLEWELASETGRITADGKLSRISVIEDADDGNSTDSSVDSRAFSRMSQQDQGYDINSRLREDELVDDMEEGDTQEEEVRALH